MKLRQVLRDTHEWRNDTVRNLHKLPIILGCLNPWYFLLEILIIFRKEKSESTFQKIDAKR